MPCLPVVVNGTLTPCRSQFAESWFSAIMTFSPFFIAFAALLGFVSSCDLTSGAKKPVPALLQCFKYNQNSCCTSGHDAIIKSYYSQLLSPSCQDEFPNFEEYFCFACHPDQPDYIVGNELLVCKSFADAIFGDGRNFDNCGLLVNQPGLQNICRFRQTFMHHFKVLITLCSLLHSFSAPGV